MGEIVHLDVQVEGLEAAVAVRQLKIDDVGVLGAEDPRHGAERTGNVAKNHREASGAAVRSLTPGEVEPVRVDSARQRVAADHMYLDLLVLAPEPDDPVSRDRVAAL